ncbi:hypothetical protein CLIB1423_01S06656 [[Candida] railenensis]|uniref:Uncharacterized protein n=1 Tax=[Candida] railenensis TaxID=45579 RepID=A0A9P0QKF7_9ASCO|nr:hypothetical protein CLIB1423_01S06656 [[Candida] railenensis]
MEQRKKKKKKEKKKKVNKKSMPNCGVKCKQRSINSNRVGRKANEIRDAPFLLNPFGVPFGTNSLTNAPAISFLHFLRPSPCTMAHHITLNCSPIPQSLLPLTSRTPPVRSTLSTGSFFPLARSLAPNTPNFLDRAH